MRTSSEISARIKELESNDFWSFQRGDLIDYLPFSEAKPHLKEGVTAKQWQPQPSDRESVISQIKEYMPFAWEKANDRRGLSAGRSINHMQAWLWMLGEDAAAEALEDYSLYGKPQLRAICERYDIDWRAMDDGLWTNSEDDDGSSPEGHPALNLPWRGASAQP